MKTILTSSKISPELKQELMDIMKTEKCTLFEAEQTIIIRELDRLKKKNNKNINKKIFFTYHCDGTYYVSELGKKGLQIDNMTRKDLFNLWWSVFKEWIIGDPDYG